jgi:hypothetical protein
MKKTCRQIGKISYKIYKYSNFFFKFLQSSNLRQILRIPIRLQNSEFTDQDPGGQLFTDPQDPNPFPTNGFHYT